MRGSLAHPELILDLMGGGRFMSRWYVIVEALQLWSCAMPKLIDRIGQRFGRLLVVEAAGRNKLKKVMWKCVCDCGAETIAVA